VDYLEEIGELDNTFIFFMSDNGAESSRMDQGANIQEQVGKAYDHSLENLGSATSYINYGANWASVSSTPWNRHKASAYEGGNREPAFAWFPKRIKAGTSSAATGTIMDMLPTFLDLAGASHPGSTFRGREVQPLQGASLMPLLTGQSDTIHGADAVFAFELLGQRSVRQGDWKIVWDTRQQADAPGWQLFNLRNDIGEQHNLAAGEPEQLAKLVAQWDRFVADNGVILGVGAGPRRGGGGAQGRRGGGAGGPGGGFQRRGGAPGAGGGAPRGQ
jgi:arylsulfatase